MGEARPDNGAAGLRLYDFQEDLVEKTRQALSRGSRVCLTLPTGGGKTVLAAEIIRRALAKGRRCLFIVHRQELAEQAAATLRVAGLHPTLLLAGTSVGICQTPCQVAMAQTLTRRTASMRSRNLTPRHRPDIVFFDECHHITASTWKSISDACRAWNPSLLEVGLTATPRRTDGKGLDERFDELVLGPSIGRLVEMRRLSPFTLVSTRNNLSALRRSLKKRGSDFDSRSQSEAVGGRMEVIVGDTLELYRRHADGAQAIFFGADIAHSKETAAAFRAAGIKAAHIDGKTDIFARQRAIGDFRRGELKVICNFGIINEGFDVPNASCVILARHTSSEIFYLQALGRGLRYVDGKTAVLIDQAANWRDLGLPDDERGWSLSGMSAEQTKERTAAAASRSYRLCKPCQAVHKLTEEVCRICARPLSPPADVVQAEMEMEVIAGGGGAFVPAPVAPAPPPQPKITKVMLFSKIEQIWRTAADDESRLTALKDLEKELGYAPGWAQKRLDVWKGGRAARV